MKEMRAVTRPPATLPEVAFFVVGGTMPPDAPCYVERTADRELFTGLSQGEFCYVLTSRQMGKSSLMVRTASRLRAAGIAVVVLDVTAIGQNLTVEQWYQGLLGRAARQLGLEAELEEFWLQHAVQAPLQRFIWALEQMALGWENRPGRPQDSIGFPERHTQGSAAAKHPPLVVFIDEIDFVLSLPFPTDELFAAIRECYNRRADEPELRSLTFCLLGVASPADLIQDPRSTPFNIGRRIELTDFTAPEAAPLAAGLLSEAVDAPAASGAPTALLDRVLYWTNGQPYLTQRLCDAVRVQLSGTSEGPVTRPAVVDSVCDRIFLAPGSERRDDNLMFVRERVLRGDVDSAAILELYQRVHSGRHVIVDAASAAQETLRLAGLAKPMGGMGTTWLQRWKPRHSDRLTNRNRIYQRVFDGRWIRENMPDAEVRRQRAAYRRGLVRATAVGAVVVSLMVALAAAALINGQRANESAGKYQAELHQKVGTLNRLKLALEEVKQERRTARFEATRAQRAESQERGQRTTAERERRRAELQTLLARANGAETKHERNESQRRLVRLLVDTGERARAEGELSVALLWLVEALKRDKQNSSREEIHRLRIEDLLRYCPRVTQIWQQPGRLACVAMSSDGSRMAAFWGKGVARIWDVKTGKGVGPPLTHRDAIVCMAFSPDGRRLLTGSHDQTAQLWDAHTGLPVAAPFRHSDTVRHVSFSIDGTRLLTGGDNGVRVWSSSSGKQVGPLLRPAEGMTVANLSPDGTRVVTGGLSRTAQVWSVSTGEEVTPVIRHDQAIGQVCFSPNGRSVATASNDFTARVWDAATGAAITPPLRHQNAVSGVQFSPDGLKLVSNSGDWTARIWDARTGAPGPILTHAGPVNSAAFTLDGTRVLTSSDDSTVRVWNAVSGQAAAAVLRHEGPALGAVMDNSQRWLITRGAEGAIRLWDMAGAPEGSVSPTTGGRSSRLHSHGSSGFTQCEDGTGVLWTQGAGAFARIVVELGKNTLCSELSPNGQYLAAGGNTSIQLWNTRTGKKRWNVNSPTRTTIRAAFSRDSTRLATGEVDGSVRVWDTASGRPCYPPFIHQGRLSSVAFSPDGKRLAVISTVAPAPRGEGRLSVWDLTTNKRLPVDGGGRSDLTSAEFSPDSRFLVTASRDGGARVLDVTSGQPRTSFLHPGVVWHARFSANGARVITAGEDGMVRIWNAINGGILTPPLKHPRPVMDASFGPDGSLVLTKGDAEIQVWDALTGEAVTAPVRFPVTCERARFTAPRHVVAEVWDGTILRWDLPAMGQSAATLETLAMLVSGRRLGEGLSPMTVPPRDIPKCLKRLRHAAPEILVTPSEQLAAWHVGELERSEQSSLWSGVLTHGGQLALLRPREWRYLARRGVAHAELGQWSAAAVDLRQALELGGDDRLIWYRLALAQLAGGDQNGFQLISERMLNRLGNSVDVRAADLAAWTRALGHGSGPTVRSALGVLHRIGQGTTPDASWLGSLGALQLRSGQHADAVSSLQRAIALRHGEGTVPDHLFLTMAYARLGQTSESRQALDRALAMMNRARVQGDALTWEDRVEQQVLLREAEDVLRSIR